MIIELKGKLPKSLQYLGLKPGQRFNAQRAENTSYDAVRFQIEYEDEWIQITIQPKNYKEV